MFARHNGCRESRGSGSDNNDVRRTIPFGLSLGGVHFLCGKPDQSRRAHPNGGAFPDEISAADAKIFVFLAHRLVLNKLGFGTV